MEAAQPVALHLLRHAHAGDPEAWQGDDDARPLSAKGVGQAERLGRHLASVGFDPDTILSSPKVRAYQTARLVADALGLDVTVDERLGEAVDLQEIAAILQDAGSPRRPVLVGHDPDFSDVLVTLAGARTLPMRKGAIARIDLVIGLEPGGGVLRWLLPPDLLPKDGRASG